jgi:hypothetical protein
MVDKLICCGIALKGCELLHRSLVAGKIGSMQKAQGSGQKVDSMMGQGISQIAAVVSYGINGIGSLALRHKSESPIQNQ